MNFTEFPSDPASFPDVAASFMLAGPVGKQETYTDRPSLPMHAVAWP